jgi:hypothetical protein
METFENERAHLLRLAVNVLIFSEILARVFVILSVLFDNIWAHIAAGPQITTSVRYLDANTTEIPVHLFNALRYFEGVLWRDGFSPIAHHFLWRVQSKSRRKWTQKTTHLNKLRNVASSQRNVLDATSNDVAISLYANRRKYLVFRHGLTGRTTGMTCVTPSPESITVPVKVRSDTFHKAVSVG